MSTTSLETPFLPKPDSTPHETAPSTLDDLMEAIVGQGLGYPQLLQSLLILSAWFFDAQQVFITVFSDAVPTWHCIGELNYCHASNSNILPPSPFTLQKWGTDGVCDLSPSSWAWDKPAYTSTISEWSLQCAGSSFLSGLPTSSFFAGCLFGGFVLTSLADSVGRKNSLLIACLLMSVPTFLASFSPNVWVYTALKFVTGFGRAAVGSTILVLPSEILGRQWRSRVGIAGFNFFTLGFLSLPGIAYLSRGSSWRVMYLSTSIPTIFYCILIYLFVSESPRWLIIQGREDEAVVILKKLASPECKVTINKSLIATLVSSNEEDRRDDFLSSIKLLLKTSWAFQRLVIAMVVGFCSGAAYYGMPQNLGNLTVNFYLSVALNALMEVPANGIALFLIAKWTTRRLLCFMSITGGVCSIIYALTSDHYSKMLQIGLELASFSSVTMAFALFLIFGLELFPTCVRNSAVMLLRQSAVIGGIFSPLLIALGGHSTLLSYGVFGVLLLICAIFVFYLPETKINAAFCDTMDEQEDMEKAAVLNVTTSCV